MATQPVVLSVPDTHMGAGRTVVATVSPTPLANGDNTASVSVLGFDEAVVAISGTFGAGGSVTVEGSIDGTTWYAVPSAVGLPITAAGVAALPNLFSRFLRARVTAGDGTTALTAVFLLRTRSR